jgi:hypothetical protein
MGHHLITAALPPPHHRSEAPPRTSTFTTSNNSGPLVHPHDLVTPHGPVDVLPGHNPQPDLFSALLVSVPEAATGR